MKYGLSQEQLKEINEVLSSYDAIEQAILFGSRAIDTYKEASDVDIAIKGKNVDWSLAMKVKSHLEETYLPFFFDVVAYNSIKSEKLRQHVDKKGKVVFNRGMSEWREVELSNHIDLISGYAFKSKDFLDRQEQATLPVIKIKNVANGDVNLEKVVFHKYSDSLSKILLSKGDVLIAMTGNHPQAKNQVVGAVSKYKLGSNALLNQRVGKIIPIGSTDLDFVYYFFKDKDIHSYLANESSGSANQANISKATIIGIKTDFPEPEEQKAIADVLSSLDDKIDLLHRQNKTIEQMAETLFRQWFVEEAGDDWEEGLLSDLIVVKYGKDHKKLLDGNIPVFGSGGVMRYVEKSLYNLESVLIPRKGTLSNVIYIDEPFWSVDTMFYTEMKKPNLAKFVYHFVQMQDLASLDVGSAVPSMTTEILNNIVLNIPTDVILKEFEILVTPMYKKMKSNQTQISTLENIRNTLLPKLMSGEVRIAING